MRERSYLWRIRLAPLYSAVSHSRLLQLLRMAILPSHVLGFWQ